MGAKSEFVEGQTAELSEAGLRPGAYELGSGVGPFQGCHIRSVALPLVGVVRQSSFARLWLLMLTAAICCLPIGATPEQYYIEFEPVPPPTRFFEHERNLELARERQESFRKRVAIPNAVGDDVPLAAFAETANRQSVVALNASSPGLARISRRTLLIAGAFMLTGLLVLWKLLPDLITSLNAEFNPWATLADSTSGLEVNVRAEDEDFAEFTTTFWTGPPLISSSASSGGAAGLETEPLQEFFARVPRVLGELGHLLVTIAASSGDGARRRVLADLQRELIGLKGQAGHSELLPVWQMTSALEGLVKQLTDKVSNVTPSTLRTVNEGVDLLKRLCVPGLRPDLLSNPPLRLLAVDDDMISRNAVSLALKRALNIPNLAETSEAAFVLAAQRAYDVIFLDVQMPGMDGFELCSQIHGTVANATTPVVFVTCHNDFEARAQAALSGGSDLIGKPFLTFEITVKALTLALQGRLSRRAELIATCQNQETPLEQASVPAATASANHPLPVSEPDHAPATVLRHADAPAIEVYTKADWTSRSEQDTDTCQKLAEELVSSSLQPAADSPRVTPATPAPDKLTQEFLTRASVHLGPLRELIQQIFQSTDEQARQAMLADIYLRFNGMTPKVVTNQGHPALRLSGAVEGLLKKLLESPKHCSSSALLTVATALDLLHELCEGHVTEDLATHPPIRLLVVDDDPVARRAMSCALQMAFDRPACADSGESALGMAADKSFDVVFMDVQMPGMDGFTACLRLHETETNRHTPVVFVTAHNDFKSRSQATMSGGSDFIAKPFLTAEIKVKALTFALRGRLQQFRAHHRAKPCSSQPTLQADELVPVYA